MALIGQPAIHQSFIAAADAELSESKPLPLNAFKVELARRTIAAVLSELTQAFKEAGWEVQAEQVSGVSLKPGVMTLMADEQYPSWIDTVVKGLEASGLETKSASGYRAYYESKKAENPNWPGIPMRADQDFIIVVGPKATS